MCLTILLTKDDLQLKEQPDASFNYLGLHHHIVGKEYQALYEKYILMVYHLQTRHCASSVCIS